MASATDFGRLVATPRKDQVSKQNGNMQQICRRRYGMLDGLSIPGGLDHAGGLTAVQQGFPGSDYQHSKELFQLSVASCEKPPGYAAKLDVVDAYDLLENRPSALTERPGPPVA
jgi:hypothetical protein